MVIFPDGLLGKIAGAASVTGAPHGDGSEQQAACSKWVLGGGRVNPHPTTSDKWYCLAPPSQGLPLGRAVPVGRQGGLLYYLAPPSQVPPLGRANHISLSPVISQRVRPLQSIDKALCHSGESQFALQAAAVALHS